MQLQSKVFTSGGSWDGLCAEVCEWVNEHLKPKDLVSVSMSESGRTLMDTNGTIIVWFWAGAAE